jgi:hypothetical protein
MPLSPKTSKLFIDYATNKINKMDSTSKEFYDYCITDLNSSKLREELTILICGYDQVPGKLDYDGFDKNTNRYKEAKPKLFTNRTPHNGNGNFSDLTMENLEKLVNGNVDIVVSLFAFDRLVYIMEFPASAIYDRLHEVVHQKCVVQNQSACRNAAFTYKHYMDSKDLKINYIDWDFIDKYPRVLNDKFLQKLKGKRIYENTIEPLFECEAVN